MFICIGICLCILWFSYRIATGNHNVPLVSSFIQDHVFPSEVPQKKLTTLIMTGDVMLGRTVEITAKEKHDMNYPFLKMADTVKSADIAFVNLENPIIDGCKPFTQGLVFCANPDMLDGLVYAGIDVVTLANNHSLNYGEKGVRETEKHLESRGISYTGDGNLTMKQVNNVTFGFLGFDKAQQGNPVLTSDETNLIKESDKKVDVLIVAMHWGVEYKDKALPGVRKLAKELVQDGADVVVGSHPHWVEDREYLYKDGAIVSSFPANLQSLTSNNFVPIYYSLGNFVFDQMWSEKTRHGLAVRLTFDGKNIVKEELLPTYIKERGQPEWVNN